jgi:hypothetical protein
VALVCNIDQRGRAVRYRIGLTLVTLAVLLTVASRLLDKSLLLFVSAPLGAAGLFSLFEANRSWCAVRALGFKTRL